jgi:hypothetical protein
VHLKHDGTRWRTEGEVKGKLTNGVGSQHSSHYLGTWTIQHYYRWCAHLGCQQSIELTPPADLNGLVRFAERRNLVSARVPLCFKSTITLCTSTMGCDRSVGIATRYGLEVPGIESWWGRVFPYPSRPALGLGTGSGVKRPERGFDLPLSSRAEVKERVQLYIYSPSGPSWSVIGWIFPLPLFASVN